MNYLIKPSTLNGRITVTTSKSHTLRAILFASLAHGDSIIKHYLKSPDTVAMINACELLGAKIKVTDDQLNIRGVAGKPHVPDNVIDAGNSGQVLRFVAAIAALLSNYTVITGDRSIRTNRPIQPLLDALSNLGVTAISTKNDGYAPIIIKGPMHNGVTTLNGEDSQPVSAMLIASAFISGKTEINVINPGEKPWVNLTLDWFKRLGISCDHKNFEHYVVQGGANYAGFNYTVPSDFSSVAFPLVAALITRSDITIDNIDMQDVQGDKAIIFALQEMGAKIDYDEKSRILHVKKNGVLKGNKINVNDFIDAIPILAVAGCFAEGTTEITGAAIAKHKESDRLVAMTTELKKMGADIIDNEDGLIIKQSQLMGAKMLSYHDHRIAMSLSVAGLAAQGDSLIEDVSCVAKSFPGFAGLMQGIGAKIIESH